VHTDVGENWLDNAQSPGVDAFSLLSVDFGHRVAGRGQCLPALCRRHTWEQEKLEATLCEMLENAARFLKGSSPTRQKHALLCRFALQTH